MKRKNIEKEERGFFLLLGILIGALILWPFFASLIWSHLLFLALFSLILIYSIYVLSHRKFTFYLGLALLIPAFTLNWIAFFHPFPLIKILASSFSFSFILLVIVTIYKSIFSQKSVSLNTVYGAICLYLFLGIAWAEVYSILVVNNPDSFSIGLKTSLAAGSEFINEVENFLYYSYVTLTTLGYGDITPISPAAKHFSILEAISGQLYIATFVARIVGMYLGGKSKKVQSSS